MSIIPISMAMKYTHDFKLIRPELSQPRSPYWQRWDSTYKIIQKTEPNSVGRRQVAHNVAHFQEQQFTELLLCTGNLLELKGSKSLVSVGSPTDTSPSRVTGSHSLPIGFLPLTTNTLGGYSLSFHHNSATLLQRASVGFSEPVLHGCWREDPLRRAHLETQMLSQSGASQLSSSSFFSFVTVP